MDLVGREGLVVDSHFIQEPLEGFLDTARRADDEILPGSAAKGPVGSGADELPVDVSFFVGAIPGHGDVIPVARLEVVGIGHKSLLLPGVQGIIVVTDMQRHA